MKIIDQNGNVLENPDLSLGRLVPDKLFVQHHEAVEAVEGKGDYKTIREYPNGGKDVQWVWDVEPVQAREAWDEYEDVQKYVPYTPEELAQREAEREEAEKKNPEYRIAQLETKMADMEAAYTEGVNEA